MTTVVTQCRRCGVEFEPSTAAIRAGSWRVCPTCAPKQEAGNHCRECGRPLAGKREICLRCRPGSEPTKEMAR